MISISMYEFASILVVGAALLISLVVGSLLAFKMPKAPSGTRWASGFLSTLLLLSSLTLFGQMLSTLELPEGMGTLCFVPFSFTLWLGPLVYLYVVARLVPTFRFRWRHALHFTLPALQTGFHLYTGFHSHEVKTHLWLTSYQNISQAEDLVFYCGFALYLLAAYLHLRAATRAQRTEVTLWLEQLTGVAVVLIAAVVLFDVGETWVWRSYRAGYGFNWFEEPQAVLYSAILFWIAFNGLQAHHTGRQLAPPGRKERYNLGAEQVAGLGRRLDTLMEADKLYLDAELSLASLAEQLTVSPKELSLVINESKQKNFHDYLNGWRVRETARLLSHPEHQGSSLLEIAFAAGFNSKATFNRVFKQATGMTPSQYRQERMTRKSN